MNKTTVIYRDVAVGAENNVTPSIAGGMADSSAAVLPFGVANESIATAELNAWMLDGTRRWKETQPIAFWSKDISGEDGIFAAPPSLTFNFSQNYTTTGITIVFDEADGDFATPVLIEWYQGGTLKSSKEFYPDAQTYFCANKVEAFNKIVITIYGTRFPRRRAKINQIVFGIIRTYDVSEIRNAKITNEMSLSGLELPVSRFSWTLDSKEAADFLFQLKQPVEVRNNQSPLGVYYVESAKRASGRLYNIECHDPLGVLDGSQFAGGAYLGGVSALALFTEVVGGAFDIVCTSADKTLYGLLKPSTRRSALQQIAFAWGVSVAADENGAIRIFDLPIEAKEIGLDRTYSGVSVETAAIVTGVTVTAHSYATTTDATGVEVGGKYYKDTKTQHTITNPNITPADKENVITVEDATLVSSHNVAAVAQRLYDYHLNRNTNTARIVWDGERLGDRITVPSEWGDTTTGNVGKMDIVLSNTVAVSCETVGM